MDKQTEFIFALTIAEQRGFLPFIVYVHAYHETGGFVHPIGNNFFGLKPPTQIKPPREGWTGTKVLRTTHETIKGTSVKLDDYFCDFATAADCIQFYCFQITRLFPFAYANRQDPTKYFDGLFSGNLKFATDLNYLPTIKKLYTHLLAEEPEKILGILKNEKAT